MSIFKCKMCGGTLEINENERVATCEYCGTKQTLPRLDDDRKANLYDRANHFRRNNEFDKAAGIYEQILNEDKTDAEAYWSLVLCRYGIEYVEDPATHRRLPTVNRAQFTSVFDDDNYKSALDYASIEQREIYKEEANAINEIQKGILAISEKEEPFDVFICYKETDAQGRRTPDSVLATELYHELTKENFKVFFSRITLEDKLGTAYEPYIFAALNSAKVMVVIGTRPEYFNAVWVKNEWSRYLALIKNGAKKMLIPAYRDMDPYDLPEEFSHLQAQDMSKLGFMQDLIRGIKKIISADEPKAVVKETVVVSGGNANIAPLLKRAFMFLEDGNWQDADEYCEKVLDQNPECAEAYLGKLMAELKVNTADKLKDLPEPFDDRNNYSKALRFGDEKLAAKLKDDNTFIRERNENARLTGIYSNAKSIMSTAKNESDYLDAARTFKSIPEFRDSKELAKECKEKAEISRKDFIYLSGKQQMANNSIAGYESAIKYFESIPGWKDSGEQIEICKQKIEEMKAKEDAERLEKERKAEIERKEAERIAKRNKKIAMIATPIVCAIIAFVIVLDSVIIPSNKYKAAMELYNAGEYEEAFETFEALGGYKDSIERTNIARIQAANVGNTIIFGTYEQDNDTSNGNEDLEWLVLAKEDGKLLVISDKALDCQPYNITYEYTTWEQCSLRKWLNETFINDAFSENEQVLILNTTVSADKNPLYNTNPGEETIDKVFLLSISEAEKYFSSNDARKCVPTAYAKAQGVPTSDRYSVDGRPTCWWWLRSPGYSQNNAAHVISDGDFKKYGIGVNCGYGAVRPAMWIDLSSLNKIT